MAAPGTAYVDDPDLGTDRQPKHMDDFYDGPDDYGGVHINSGIPNHAFFRVATALGGKAWEKAGRIGTDAAQAVREKPVSGSRRDDGGSRRNKLRFRHRQSRARCLGCGRNQSLNLGRSHPRMRIVFRQSGGSIGTPREVDTANLAEPAGREAEELLNRAGIHGSISQTSSKARDATRYELTITDGNKTIRIVTDDATVSSQLLPLIEFLRESPAQRHSNSAAREIEGLACWRKRGPFLLRPSFTWWSIIERRPHGCAFIQDGRTTKTQANITVASLSPVNEPLGKHLLTKTFIISLTYQTDRSNNTDSVPLPIRYPSLLLSHGEPNAISNAKFYTRLHDIHVRRILPCLFFTRR